jgi:hypothetical protein
VCSLFAQYLQWFRGGVVFEAHRLFDHSPLGVRVIKGRRRYLPGSAAREDCGKPAFGFSVHSSGFRVQGVGCRIKDVRFRDEGFGFRI